MDEMKGGSSGIEPATSLGKRNECSSSYIDIWRCPAQPLVQQWCSDSQSSQHLENADRGVVGTATHQSIE